MTVISAGCDNCKYLTGKRCKLWQVKVQNPNDSHCESWQKDDRPGDTDYIKQCINRGFKANAEQSK